MSALRPTSVDDLQEIILRAADLKEPLEIRSGGSKARIGSARSAEVVDCSVFAGVTDYEPSELTLTAGPATPLEDVQALLARHGQMLAFEPWDHGPLFGKAPGAATVGGVVAAGVAGPRRLSAGGARDHLLGFAAVSGRGENFKAGGKVVKNVTGYDLSKVIAGSWGQLAIMTELTLKVMPLPRSSTTLALFGLSPEAAVEVMSRAMGSPSAVAAAAHCQAGPDFPATTLLRIEGFSESVVQRAAQLTAPLADFGPVSALDEHRASSLWNEVRGGTCIASAECIWRAHVAPGAAAGLVTELERGGAVWCLDWAGALLWIGAPGEFDVRSAVARAEGHAMLLRAPDDCPAGYWVRQSRSAGLAALTARLKQAFDPAGILDPLRFG